jgi:hypothetical protein
VIAKRTGFWLLANPTVIRHRDQLKTLFKRSGPPFEPIWCSSIQTKRSAPQAHPIGYPSERSLPIITSGSARMLTTKAWLAGLLDRQLGWCLAVEALEALLTWVYPERSTNWTSKLIASVGQVWAR